jgi:hypothetical protein
LWERNAFLTARPQLRATIESPYVRGAVSGVGLITVIAGVAELGGVVGGRTRRQPQP